MLTSLLVNALHVSFPEKTYRRLNDQNFNKLFHRNKRLIDQLNKKK